MKLYVIRHGESENNKKGCYTGWLDVALTEKGLGDAKKAGERLCDVKFDKVYSSDLLRAKTTAKTALSGYEIDTTPLLREINIGSIAGKPLSVMTYEERCEALRVGYSSFGGESINEFHERIKSFMHNVEELGYENIATFSHAGWMRGMLDVIIGFQLPRKHIYCANCAIAIFEYTDNTWRLHSWMNL